uniref:SH2 domain-containing protein n=1 Tax=Caenorhabditis japonica TaxID=281687 RepID=A0A8R1DZ03_CAEJA
MTILVPRRRLSALIEHIKNFTTSFKSDKQYRSLSTGDLATTSKPSAFEPDFIEMNFTDSPTTSSPLPKHFDDSDLVPMQFTASGTVKLISQHSKKAMEKAEKARRCGSSEQLSRLCVDDVHRAQSWFFVDVDPRSAERILMSNGGQQSSFLISFYRGRYVLSIWRGAKIEHLVIHNYRKKDGQMAFQLDIERSFRNLVELTEYYTKNKSYVLSTKLSKGVGRPRRNQDLRCRA